MGIYSIISTLQFPWAEDKMSIFLDSGGLLLWASRPLIYLVLCGNSKPSHMVDFNENKHVNHDGSCCLPPWLPRCKRYIIRGCGGLVPSVSHMSTCRSFQHTDNLQPY